MHHELGITISEFEESEDESAQSIAPKGPEPEAKRPKLCNAAEKTERPKPKTHKRKKTTSIHDAGKENASPKTKKAKKAEKPKAKQKVYSLTYNYIRRRCDYELVTSSLNFKI